MLAHKQAKATEFSLKSVRKFYNNKIIVFENGSSELESICHKYDCEYIHQPTNYQKVCPENKYALMSSEEDFKILFDQYKYASEHLDTKWIVKLESDIIVRNHISEFPNEKYAAGGSLHKFNTYNSSITKLINNHRKNTKAELKQDYIYTGCVILNRDVFKNVIKKDWKQDITYFLEKNLLDLRCIDGFTSYILLSSGYDFQDWNQFVEIYHAEDEHRLVFAPLVHQFKHFYS